MNEKQQLAANRRTWKILKSKRVEEMALHELNEMQTFLHRRTFSRDDGESGKIPAIRLIESARAGIIYALGNKIESFALIDALNIATGQPLRWRHTIDDGLKNAAKLYAEKHELNPTHQRNQ